MASLQSTLRTLIAGTALTLATLLSSSNVRAADMYDAAVQHAGRSAADLKRDTGEHPADILRLAGIKPGMKVIDVLAAGGYFSELVSYIVGPSGHVLMLNNPAYDSFASNSWKARIADHHLDNTEHRTVDMAKMGLADNSFDAAILIKVYHDLYWVSDKDGWPKINVSSVLDQLARALKPGGIVLVEDHSAKAGTGSKDAGKLHRIDEAFARKDFEAHGFEFVTSSDLLRKPDDKRDALSFEGPMVGKTDRFVLVFRKKS